MSTSTDLGCRKQVRKPDFADLHASNIYLAMIFKISEASPCEPAISTCCLLRAGLPYQIRAFRQDPKEREIYCCLIEASQGGEYECSPKQD